VKRAGGEDGEARLEGINLAARLADGQQIVVPQRTPEASTAAAAGAASEDGPISLGSATEEQLDTIEGIGPVTAGDIVQFRDQHGGLSSVNQLDQISGIGPATMEALRARLQP
jgi:competence protein ComEA